MTSDSYPDRYPGAAAPAPERVCANCLATWRAAKPQPAAVYCHHMHRIAWPTVAGWRVEMATDSALRNLRMAGAL